MHRIAISLLVVIQATLVAPAIWGGDLLAQANAPLLGMGTVMDADPLSSMGPAARQAPAAPANPTPP